MNSTLESPNREANLESNTEVQDTKNTTQPLTNPGSTSQEVDNTTQQLSSSPQLQQPTHNQSIHPRITSAKAGMLKPEPRLYLTTSNIKISVPASVSEALQDQN